MDKVKVTREQADLISSKIKEWEEDDFFERHTNPYNGVSWVGSHSALNDISNVNMAKIIYGAGYEVEEEFKEGDYVTFDGSNVTITGFLVWVEDILKVNSHKYPVPQNIPLKDLRLATKEEILKEKNSQAEKELKELIPKLNLEEKEMLLKASNKWVYE